MTTMICLAAEPCLCRSGDTRRVSACKTFIDARRAYRGEARYSLRSDTPMGDWFPKQTLGSLPERAARRWGAREALYFNGRRWSFTELSRSVDRLARGLLALVVRPGEKVALWMVNRPEFIEAMFAVIKI